MTVSSSNHWWQNWSKTHAFVAEKMFFPSSANDVAETIRTAEADRRPLRAVGGGWSFSDAPLPGMTTTNRPNVYGVEALAAAVPRAETFPLDRTQVSVASIEAGAASGDSPGSMVMLNEGVTPPVIDARWDYIGGGTWINTDGNVYPRTDDPAGFVNFLAKNRWRPIRVLPAGRCLEEGDTAGSLVMFDLQKSAAQPDRDWFYNGGGVWSVGVSGDGPPDEGSLQELSNDLRLMPPGPRGMGLSAIKLSPRAGHAGEAVSLLLSKRTNGKPGSAFADPAPAAPEPVYLVNTRSLVSSLQERLPSILSEHARDASSEQPSTGLPQQFLFHVEAGVTIAELGPLLAHQSPRLTLRAISGSPGATLAGALSTATHGAEFNWAPLIDTVKAVHLVGPGGVQWWIEGDESIADPAKLQEAYPDIARHRIISGSQPVDGVIPQDWLKAVVVSMGTMGVLYSVVLEAAPLFGVREVVVQTTWSMLGSLGSPYDGKDLSTLLRSKDARDVSARVVELLKDGARNGTGIARGSNQYVDLAINPNKRDDGDYDCWVGNREVTQQVPVDPQPAPTNPTTDMLQGITRSPELLDKLRDLFGFSGDLFGLPDTGHIDRALRKLRRVMGAADTVDVALDTLLTPLVGHADIAQLLLTGILSGLLSTANCERRSDKTGVSVGAVGFPDSGVIGTAIEVALSPEDAFGFLQTEILDHATWDINGVAQPFFGYVSIRLCRRTETLLGMQQFGDDANPCSVMIEVVGYGTDASRYFMAELQQRTVDRMEQGLDAMLHWGLENDRLTAQHLRDSKALQANTRSRMTKLDTFKRVRALIQAAAPGAYRIFDNNFTERLGLSDTATAPDVSYLLPLLLAPDESATTNISYLVPLLLGTTPGGA